MLGIDFTIAIVLIVSVSAYFYLKESIDEAEELRNQHKILVVTEQIDSGVNKASEQCQNYIFSGRAKYLDDFHITIAGLNQNLDDILLATNTDTRKYRKSLQVNTLTHQKISNLSQLIVTRIERGQEAAIAGLALQPGQKESDKLNRLLSDIKNKELGHFDLANEKRIHRSQMIILFFGVLLVNVFTVLGLVYYVYKDDLTGRKKAQKELRAASDHIHDLYNNAPCGYHSWNSDGIITDMNDTELRWLGYEREEVINVMHISDLLSPKSKKLFRKYLAKLKNSRDTQEVELSIITKSGEKFAVQLSGSAMFDFSGEFIKSRETIYDITERKHSEMMINKLNKSLVGKNDQLESKNKELESFSYSVSHDLRAPLRAIDGFANILKTDYGDKIDAEGLRLIDIVCGNSRRMGQLIDDLLAFSRLSRKDLSDNKINMQVMVRSVMENMKINVPSNKLIEVQFDDMPNVTGDNSLLEQVWVNLVSNAIKYSNKQEQIKIKIGSYRENDEQIFFVQDNGVGFDMKYYGKLFGVFQRLHSNEEFEGTGVGLAIVHRVITRHGGRVWADAKLNEGSTFYFSLPVNSLV